MLRTKSLPIFILIILLLGSCAMSDEQSFFDEAGAPAMEAPMEETVAEGEMADRLATDADDASVVQEQVQEQLIIRTGEVEIIVADTEDTLDDIVALANERGGWVVSSRVFQRDQAKAGSVTIRVPVDTFDGVMQEIESLAMEVISTSSRGEDVTEEYVDLSARLENLEATADRVRQFLDDAENVEEALAVNAELSRLEGEIEALRGRIQYLAQSAAFSTITVRIQPDELAQPLEVSGWRPAGEVREALEALISALQGLATVAIWLLLVFLPIALLVVIPLWFLVTLIRRYRRRRRGTAVTEAE